MNHTESLNFLPQLAERAIRPVLADSARPAADHSGQGGHKVLVVRDHPYVLEMLARVLGDLDANVQILDSATAPGQTDHGLPRASGQEIGLTGRQAEVLGCMVQGLPNKLICRRLSISPGTVKNHVSAILRALKVDNRTQAVVTAGRLGFTVDHACTGGPARRTQDRK